MEFSLESYGLGDDRVLRYLNGVIIKETPVQHYFTLLERLVKEKNNKNEVEDRDIDVDVKEEIEVKLEEEKEIEEDDENKNKKQKSKGRTKNKYNKDKHKDNKRQVKEQQDIRNNEDKDNKDNKKLEVEIDEEFLSELHKLNCSNWNLTASTICMASTLSNQKELPLEWDESKMDQLSGYNTLAKIKGIFDHLNQTKNLQLSHTVNKQESKTLKYSIFNRNEKLDEMSEKTTKLSKRILTSLNLQIKFLKIIKDIKNEFKVHISHRNPVDLTSLDVDYPTSFSINVLFFDVSYNPGNVNLVDYRTYTHLDLDDYYDNDYVDDEYTDNNKQNKNKHNNKQIEIFDMESYDSQKENVWDLWELHNGVSPYVPQQCLVSYYESENDDELNTRLTFPQQVSHFIEDNYTLSINSATVPLYTNDNNTHKLLYHLRRGRTCLIDRFIFCVLSQYCYCNVKAGRNFLHIGDSTIFIKNLSSESIFLVCENEELEVSYKPNNTEEKGKTIWKLLVAKLRDLHVQNWKRQKYLLSNKTHNILGEFLKYAVKLIRYRNKHFSN